MTPDIETCELTKRYGKRSAVSELSLSVDKGSVFGFLGPNGAGKTTTIRMMLGLARPTSGTINLLGNPIPGALSAIRRRIGVLLEPPTFYPSTSSLTNLKLLAFTSGVRKTRRELEELLDLVGLGDEGKKKVRAFSHGMRQRLGIAACLLHHPDLIVLDEPLTGLDPDGIRQIRGLVNVLAKEGKTVFLSSHLLAEVQQVCTHVGFLKDGKLIGQFSIDEALQKVQRVRVSVPDTGEPGAILRDHGWRAIEQDGSLIIEGADRDQVRDLLVAHNFRDAKVSEQSGNLEDVYVELTGKDQG